MFSVKMVGLIGLLVILSLTFIPGGLMARDIPPPMGMAPLYVIKNMDTTAEVDGDLAKFKTTVSLSVLRSGWHSIRLFPATVSLTDFRIRRGKAKEVILHRKKDAYYVLVGAKGEYQIEFEHMSRIRSEKLGRAVDIHFLQAVNSSVKFIIPIKDAKVSVTPEINFGVLKGKGKTTEVLLFNPTVNSVKLSWSADEIIKQITATYFAEQKIIYTVSKGSLKIDTFLDYSVLQGELNEFEIALSPELSLIDVIGGEVKKWNMVEKAGQKKLVLETRTGVTKSFSVRLVFEKELDAIPIVFSAPRVQPLGVEREKGYIAVIPKKGIRVEVASLENITQVDVQDLPFDRRRIPQGVSLGFKYLKRPFKVMLRADDIVPKVFADVITLAKVSKDSARLDTTIYYTIREAGVFHFKIKLAEGVRIINIDGRNINNWQVKDDILTIDLRSKAEGSYRFFISTEKSWNTKESVPLPVVQVLEVEREQGYLGVLALPGIKAEVDQLAGISQINIREFPFMQRPNQPGIPKKSLRKSAPPTRMNVPLDLAFRYLRHPYTLTLSISDIKPEVSAEVQTAINLDERKLSLSSSIFYNIRKAGVFSLKLSLPRELHIVDVQGANIDTWKRSETDDTLLVTLSSRVEGKYRLVIEAEMPLEKLPEDFTMPSLRLLDIKKEQGYLTVKADSALRVKTDLKNTSKLTEIDLKDLPRPMFRSDLTLAYKYFEQPWKLTLNVEKVKPTVMAETFHFVSIGESLVHTSATIKYQVQYAGVAEFKLFFPKDAVNIDIKGDNIKHKGEEKKDDGITWTVSLHSPRLNVYKLYVTFQTEMKKADGGQFEPIAYTGIKVLDVERETGYLAFAARPDMELSESEPENLTPIDEREIPVAYKVGIDHPILMAFRYLKHPYQLTTMVKQHEFSEVLVAVIDACRLSTTISENGQLITDIICQIRNTREQYVRLYLPPDAEIWHTRVAGQTVTCFQGDEKGVPVTLIPIAQQSKSEKAFTVNIRYAWKIKELGQTGMLKMACPQINIPIMRLGWRIALPEKYEVVMDSGNMEQVSGFEPIIARLNYPTSRQGAGRLHANSQKQEIVKDPQRIQNELALGNIVAIKGRRGGSTGLPAVYTGEAPTTGKVYYFQSLISLDVPGQVSSHYVKTAFGNTSKGLMVLLMIGGILFFWFRTGFDQVKKMAWLIGTILVIVGLHTLLGRMYVDFFNLAIGTLVVMTFCLAAWFATKQYIYPWLTEWREQSQERQTVSQPSKVMEVKPMEKPEEPKPEEPQNPSAG